jgi:hypothetical protein
MTRTEADVLDNEVEADFEDDGPIGKKEIVSLILVELPFQL